MDQNLQPTFLIKRLIPTEAITLLRSWTKEKNPLPLKSYEITTDEQRFNLIRRVKARELTIKEAAKIYGLKYTTAKTVWKIYKHEGRFDKKKYRNKKFNKNETKGSAESEKFPQTEISKDHATSPSVTPCCIDEKLMKRCQPDSTLESSFWASQIAKHFA